MSGETIGTCSLCGGRVVRPMHSTNPVDHCVDCGAYRENTYGPVIPMKASQRAPSMQPRCTCGDDSTSAVCLIHGLQNLL